MNKDELFRKSMFNHKYFDLYIHNEYDKYIQKEYLRIVGENPDKELTEVVVNAVCNRLSEISVDCDISVLVFDCLRKEILQKARDNKDDDLLNKLSIHKETELNIDNENAKLLLEVVLSLLSKKQLKYFLDRYYYFRNVKLNKHYECLISGLFKGKGIASVRFEYLKLTPEKTEVIPYALYLEHLDFGNIQFLHDDTIIVISDKLIKMPIAFKYAERRYRISRYTIITLILIALVAGIGLFISLLLK